MDVKRIVMTLKNYKDLFFKKLNNKINKNELEEFFFWLIEHYCDVNRMKYILNPDFNLDKNQELKLLDAINSLKKNMPIQYIIGEIEFLNLKFLLNKFVLIPRPETEELVSWILSESPKNKSILDIGTGSGCIAVSLAKFSDSCQVSAWDIDRGTLDLATENALKNKVKVYYEIQDIKSIKSNKKFDIIVSNPPYITLEEKKLIKKNVLLFEPHKALFVYDKNPLFYYVKIIQFAKKSLKKNGLLFFEISERMKDDILKLLNKEGFHDIELKKDFRSKDRMVKVSF
jgi:release factor glutamine methyltransferase